MCLAAIASLRGHHYASPHQQQHKDAGTIDHTVHDQFHYHEFIYEDQ